MTGMLNKIFLPLWCAGFLAVSVSAQQLQVSKNNLEFLEKFSAPFEVAADSAPLVRHEIAEFGSCGFFRPRGVRWKKMFEDGSRLEVRCEPDPGSLLPGFHVVYQATKGAPRVEIARCLFNDGLNAGVYYTSADPAVKGPVRIEWVNVDGGKNDGGGRNVDPLHHRTGIEEPYFDAVRWSFDPATGKIECDSDKYAYRASAELPRNASKLDAYVGERVPELRRTYVRMASE